MRGYLFLVDRIGQRKLHQNTADCIVGVEPLDFVDKFLFGNGQGKAAKNTFYADLLRGFYLIFYVKFA